MNAIEIIKGICQNGVSEQFGVFNPINGDLNDTINHYFGNDYKCVRKSELYANVDYLYSYGEPLPNDLGGVNADFVLENIETNELIFIYEIENI